MVKGAVRTWISAIGAYVRRGTNCTSIIRVRCRDRGLSVGKQRVRRGAWIVVGRFVPLVLGGDVVIRSIRAYVPSHRAPRDSTSKRVAPRLRGSALAGGHPVREPRGVEPRDKCDRTVFPATCDAVGEVGDSPARLGNPYPDPTHVRHQRIIQPVGVHRGCRGIQKCHVLGSGHLGFANVVSVGHRAVSRGVSSVTHVSDCNHVERDCSGYSGGECGRETESADKETKK